MAVWVRVETQTGGHVSFKIHFIAGLLGCSLMLSGCSSPNGNEGTSSVAEPVAPAAPSELADTSNVPMTKAEAGQAYLDIVCKSQDPLNAVENLSFDQTLTQSDIPEINSRVEQASLALTRVADEFVSMSPPWPTNLQDLVLTLAAEEVVRAAEYETLLNPSSIGDFEDRFEALVVRLNQSATTTARDIRRELGLPVRGGCSRTIFTPQIFVERVRNMDPRLESVEDATLVEEVEAWCEFITTVRDEDDIRLYIPETAIPADSFADFAVGGADVMCPEFMNNVTN